MAPAAASATIDAGEEGNPLGDIRSRGLGDKRGLVAILAAIIVLGSGGSSLLAFLAARDAIRASIEGEALPAAAESVAAQIRTDLVKPVFISSMMANDSFLHGWVSEGESDLPAIRLYLGEIERRYGAVVSFFVSEATRRYYYPGGVLKTVSPEAERDLWYFRVRSMAAPYELNVDPDLAHGDRLTIFVNCRVVDAKGRFLGAAGVGLSVASLKDMAARFQNEFGTSIYFVDSGGTIIAGAPYGVGASGAAGASDASGAPPATVAGPPAGAGSSRYRRGGETILATAIALPELGWRLVAERPESMAISGARAAFILNLGLCGLALALVIVASVAVINRFQARLERAASRDPLTDALNRLAFAEVAEHALKAARRTGQALAALMFDIDDFKKVNDEFGHPAGDAVLVLVVEAAGGAIRKSDAVCRWGGDEFLCLLVGCDAEGALVIAEKIRASAAELARERGPCPVSTSAGVAELGADEGIESLVARADRALLEAKRDGKGRTRRL